MNETEEIEKLRSVQTIRKWVVYAALALLVLSLIKHNPLFVYGRVALWATAGILSLLEGTGLKKLGQPANTAWMNAAIYFGVALFPLIARR